MITKTRKKGPGLWLPAAPPPRPVASPSPKDPEPWGGGGQGGGKTLQEPPRSQDSGGQLWDLNSGAACGFPSKSLSTPLPFCSSIAVDSVRVGKSPAEPQVSLNVACSLLLDPRGSGTFKHPAISFKGWVGGSSVALCAGERKQKEKVSEPQKTA